MKFNSDISWHVLIFNLQLGSISILYGNIYFLCAELEKGIFIFYVPNSI